MPWAAMGMDLRRTAAATTIVACLLLMTSATVENDVACLKGLKDSLYDPKGYLNWNFSNRTMGFICSFHGVSCWSMSENRVLSLNLNDMYLSGQIPSALQYCASTTNLHLSGNFMADEIPTELCTWLPYLVTLDLSKNQLSGPIPNLSNCKYLYSLNLAGNRLFGRIPPTLSLLHHLIFLDLSENYLSGVIPVFYSNFDASAFVGNAALCGSPLAQCGSSSIAIIIIVVAGILGAVASLLFSYSVCRWYLNRSMADTQAAPLVPLVADHQRVRGWVEHPADLSFLMEGDGVAALELVGRGGCGEVYRAQLASKTIAIKKIAKTAPYEEVSRLLDKRTRQARSEIITVGRIQHRNLLPLLAHVPRPDCNYLVYEYMNNGSLHGAIVGSNGLRLDWLARYGIAVGIATGLEYLHHHHKPHLIHRDLKPENILLDEDLNARISDFGLAKEFPDAQTHMSMSKVAGTIGYIAPEYYQTLKFTTKCDIYSLGVILATLVMGKLPSDDFFQDTEEMSMVQWLRNVMGSAEADPRSAMDERLLGHGFEEQMVLVLKISCFCTANDPNHRPTSMDVRCMLSQIKH